jgi:myosin heavy subunit
MHTTGQSVFKITPTLKKEIIKIVDERIREAHVTKEDFSELKSIVSELAEAQKETKRELKELAEAQKETQKEVTRLDRTMQELAEAQRKTEEEVRKLTIGLNRTREDLGGLSKSFGYAFENEAYRNLPKVLKDRYAITIKDRVIRAEVGGKEVNFLGRAERDGKEIYIVGEAKTRLDEIKKRGDVIKELEEKVLAVKREYGEVEVVKLLVTHFATKGFLKKAEQEGIIVVQSYEW